MGFRINRGIFQFKDAATETFINKFKIDDRDGALVEVDADGNAVTGYLKVGEKASDSDLLDGINSSAFLRSNANDSFTNLTGTSVTIGETVMGQHAVHSGYYGLWNTEASTGTTQQYLIISAGTDTYVNGDNVYIRAGNNSNSNEVKVTTSGTYIGGNKVWHAGNDGSGSGLDADKLDGYHSNQLGNRDFTKQGFYVDGDENTYYPVVIGNGTGRYGFNRYSITRHYSSTAPWNPIGTGTHHGGLTFDFYWSGDTNWGGNHKPFRVHEFGENYTTMVGGIALARTNGMVVWLRGGHAYYELHCDALPPTITVYLEPFTDGSGAVYEPTTDVNQHKDTIWNNWPVRNGSSLYIGNRAVATEQWTDDTFLRTTEKAADSNLLDGIDSSGFWRASGSWKPTSLNSMTRVIGITAESGSSNFAIATGGGKMYPYTDGIFYQNEGAYAVLDTNSGYTRTAANAAFDAAGSAEAVRTDLTALISTATDTADNAASTASTANTTATNAANAAAVAQTTADEATTLARNAQTTADSKLGATAKAADSNLLDGIDSSAFLRSNTADTFTGTLTMGTQKALVANNYGRGVYGIYSATRYQHVWSMGTAYNLADNGTGAGNLYGIAWTHQNIGGESISGLGHQMLIMSNGDTRSAIGDGIWTKYNIYASGGNSTEWNAAYDWGNHAGLYDTVGSAAGVNTRIDDEIVPQITANTDAIINNRNEITTVGAAAAAAQSTADGKANASHDHDRLYISDTRGAARAPSYYNDRYAQWDFQNESDTGITAGDSWQALLTVSKWSVFDPSHKQEQLIFTGDDLYRRTATSDTAWGTTKKIWDSGNLNPIVGTSYNSSGDIITYTYADGTTSAIDIVDNNSNTYLTGASFNTSDGVLTLTRNSGSVTVDLDGRYDGVGSAAGVNTRIDDEIVPQITANATAIARNATALDTKLASTGKAADSNLLDGVDSSRFVYGGNATKTTNISNVSTALASGFYDGYNITGSPTGTWYTYINMRHNNTGNNYGSQIAVSFYSNADMYVRTISNGTYQGWSKIWNSANFDPSSKANTSHDHNDLYYTKAQSNANYDAAGSASTAQTNAINAANVRIDDEVFPAINTNTTNIARNATDIAGKANAGGSYSQDFAADDMRVDQWFRNTASGKGLYNEATTQHFYSDDDDYWNVAGGTGANGIRFRDEHAGTIRGYVYATNGNNIGFLDAGASWAIKHTNDNGTYFYTDGGTEEFRVGRDAVTGNYGTVQTSSTKNSWGGYSINGNYVFMSSGTGGCGIYNDVDNEWMAYFNRNGSTELHYNGSTKLATNSGGVTVTGTVTATGTVSAASFSGSGAGLTNLPIPDQSIPVQINGGGDGTRIIAINFNLDRGSIDFTLSTGDVFSAAFAR